MKSWTLKILDEVNIKFDGLEPHTRREIVNACKFFMPHAAFSEAYKLKRWDGMANFATPGGGSFMNMLDRIQPILWRHGYSPDHMVIEDARKHWNFQWPEVKEDMLAHKVWPEGHPAEGEPVMLRDYQVEVIERYLKNPASIQSISTGAGKTLITAALSATVERYGRSIVIVPSIDLVSQTEEDYINLGLDVGVFCGARKEWNRTHTICTWQSLGAFSKRDRNGVSEAGCTLEEFLSGVVCVMVDEVHSAKADVLHKMLTGPMANIPLRWGLTGTIPKKEFEYMSILCSLGPCVGSITARELINRGVLSELFIDILQLQEGDLEFKTFADEYKHTTTNAHRMKFLATYCEAIAQTGNTLILVDRIESGRALLEALGPERAVFISGKVKSKDRKKEYKEVQGADGKIIIATYGVAAVGINIPRIFNLVLLEAGKSFVRTIQSIGRGIRTAKDKDFVHVYDVTSNLKHSKKHLAERKGFYKEAEYAHRITKLEYRNLVL
jgi:superfamily II DNA or RNA helicase